jgi:thiol-disulfide isomerase/thioredoxin
MYYAIKNDLVIPADMVKHYNRITREKSYKRMVKKLLEQQSSSDQLAKRGTDYLLFSDGVKTTSLAKLIAQHAGKIVFLDFWAHWCVPCREDMPALKKLMQENKNTDIVFIKLSIDRDVQPWRKMLLAEDQGREENYLLLNKKIVKMVLNNEISSLPRYMILNKNGKVVHADAPRPTDPKLKSLIDELLVN